MAVEVHNPILIAEEIGRILEMSSWNDRERLDEVVGYLKRATRVDVCTLYRRSRRSGHLYIESTDGLARDRVGKVALKRGEGLTGLVVESRKPLPVRDGPSHPNFQFIPGLMEEAYHSYLGVPIFDGPRVIGALVVQTRLPRDFKAEYIALLTNVARQIGPTASRLFLQLDEKKPSPSREAKVSAREGQAFRGRSLAPGCFSGPPHVLDHGLSLETVITPPSRGVEFETQAIRRANRIAMAQLEHDARAISGSEGAAVLMAHKVMLEDNQLANEVLDRIKKGDSAAEAVRQTGLKWVQLLANLPDPAFAARASDFRDIANRLMAALGVDSIKPLPAGSRFVAVARLVLPGDLLRLGRDRVGALIMTDQGVYSHTAIVARSFGIPAVQLDPEHLDAILHAGTLLVDGADGIVVLDPSPEAAKEYTEKAARMVRLPEGGPTDLAGPAKTLDGIAVKIGLNAGMPDEFEDIDRVGPDEIGLYRSEIAFMSGERMPGLKAQLAHYRKIMDLAGGRHVVFRTFDFGGDKIPASLRFEREENPMMGCRSTRFMLEHPHLFETQLKALFMTSARGPMSILLPMIATPEELNLALDRINLVRNTLEEQKVPINRATKVGVMLEVPSVLFQIDELARAADFFCVGTNDLVQYLMAADRSNARVTWLYQWYHPAVLVALDRIIRHCRRNDRPVSVCGEMAANPWAALLLTGMGYNQLSMDAHAVPLIKWTLMQVRGSELRDLTMTVARATSSTEVIELLFGFLEKIKSGRPPLARVLSDALDRLRAHDQW